MQHIDLLHFGMASEKNTVTIYRENYSNMCVNFWLDISVTIGIHKPETAFEVAHTISNPTFDIFVSAEYTFMIKQFKLVRNILIILDDIVDFLNWNIGTFRNMQSIQESVYLGLIRGKPFF